MAAIIRAIDNAAKQLGYNKVKKEQQDIIEAFVSGRDVFGVLPTGFGKSLCFACLPLVFDNLLSTDQEKSIVVVTTPLTAIMKDQVQNFNLRGLSCIYITQEHSNSDIKKEVAKGSYQLIFITPELLLEHRRWRSILCSENYHHRLKAFVVDEAHTVVKWGDTFRSTLRRIGEVRSILPEGVKIMALTATARKSLRSSVAQLIGLQNPFILALCPCKANMMYAVGCFNTIPDTLMPLVERLKQERTLMPRIIIYCHRFEDCGNIYSLFLNELGPYFTDPPRAPNIPQFRLVDMFTSVTDQEIKDSIINQFTKPSQLRIVISTIAFGMGVDCPDVREIIHVGVPDDVESYVQQTGRAGRDGLPSLALLLCTSAKKKNVTKDMVSYTTNSTECRRDNLFFDMDSYVHVDMGTKCLCCDVCAKLCDCGSCDIKHSLFTFL